MEAVQQDEWTEQNCINLIEEFKKRPMLWDPNNELYYKKHMKPELWREISDAIGIPSKSCKHKMIVLMSSFRREKYKILQSVKPSSNPNAPAKKPYKTSWFAFRKMSFLMDKYKATGSNDFTDKDSEASKEKSRIIKETLLEHSVEYPIFKTRNQCRYPKNPVTVDNAADCEINGMTLDEAIVHFDDENSDDGDLSVNPASPCLPSTEDDEIRSFANFIANKMRKYSEETKNAVQAEICEIIFRADRNNVVPLPQTSGISVVSKTEVQDLF